jgi:hypothetical protein
MQRSVRQGLDSSQGRTFGISSLQEHGRCPLPSSRAGDIMFTGGGLSRNRCPVVFALLLKAIGASEGWRNAIRYLTGSLSTSNTHTAVGGLFFAPKGTLANRTHLSPRAVSVGSDTLRDSARKSSNFMQFYKIVPALLDRAAGCRSYAPKDPNFMQFYEKTPAPGEQAKLLPKCRNSRPRTMSHNTMA